VPDWDDIESSERDEDAAWRDLVARFDVPLTGQQPIPWPEREDMPLTHGLRGSQETHEAEGTLEADGQHGGSGADKLSTQQEGDRLSGQQEGDRLSGRQGTDGVPGWADMRFGAFGGLGGFGTDGVRGAFDAGGLPEPHDPDVIQAPRRIRGPAASGTWAHGAAAREPSADDDGEHYIPPAPPPLPRLDPLTKGAWAALFGGPGYLVVATAVGWSVPGFAAFCAVAAFVAGFAILVLRMNEPGPGGPDDGDDGAVV